MRESTRSCGALQAHDAALSHPRRHRFDHIDVPAYDRCVMAKAQRQFDVVIEKDSDGYLIAWVPALPGCHTQARSHDELTKRIREAIELCLEVGGAPPAELDFVGVQRVTVVS